MTDTEGRRAIFAPRGVVARFDKHKIIPEEPARAVLVRLLDFWDLNHPKTPPGPVPDAQEAVPA